MRMIGVVTVLLVGPLAARGAVAVFENTGESTSPSPHRSTAIGAVSGPALHPRATSEPTLSSDVVLGDGEHGPTGTGQTRSFTVALAAGETIGGQRHGCNGARVRLIAGPFAGSVTVIDGEYFGFGGTQLTASQNDALVKLVAQKQAAQGDDCAKTNQQIDWLGGEGAS